MTAARYSIVVRGPMEPRTLERLGGLEARAGPGYTLLECEVVDQSQLVGVLSGLSRAGIEVISATPIEATER